MIPLWPTEIEARVREAAFNMDEQVQPTEVKFCKRCVISNQRPRIVFDDEGVCSACRYAERKRNDIDWDARGEELKALLDRHRRPHSYDVIVPCSGGKDSSTIAHKLKHEYGMRPLCIKWAPFAYTDIGRANFEAFVHSGFDVMVAWPDGQVHRKLARLAFEFLGDAWDPFAFGQLCYPMHMAAHMDIGLVMFGENGEAEYGGDPAANDKPCWDAADWHRIYHKGKGVKRLIDLGKQTSAITEDDLISPFYSMPDPAVMASRSMKPEFHWWAYYKHWHPQENYYYATANTGFQANPEGRSESTYSRYASLDDRYDGEHYYLAYRKFGLGRCTSDAAHEVRDLDITRPEAVALVHKYDGEKPVRYHQEFLEYVGLDGAQYQRIIQRYSPPHLWEGDTLKHVVE